MRNVLCACNVVTNTVTRTVRNWFVPNMRRQLVTTDEELALCQHNPVTTAEEPVLCQCNMVTTAEEPVWRHTWQ